MPDILIGHRSDRYQRPPEGCEVEAPGGSRASFDPEIAEAAGDADRPRSEQVLQLAAEGVLIGKPVAESHENRIRTVSLATVSVLVDERGENDGPRGEVMPQAEPVRGRLDGLRKCSGSRLGKNSAADRRSHSFDI